MPHTTKNFTKQQSCQTEIFPLSSVGEKSVDLTLTGQDLSSDSGARLLAEADHQITG